MMSPVRSIDSIRLHLSVVLNSPRTIRQATTTTMENKSPGSEFSLSQLLDVLDINLDVIAGTNRCFEVLRATF